MEAKMKNIEDKQWKAIEEVTGMTKEDFEKKIIVDNAVKALSIKEEPIEVVKVDDNDEIKEFLEDIDRLMVQASNTATQSRVRFDPQLFMLWRLYKRGK